MNVGLFIPCYIDQCHPRVGIATLRLLERLGMNVSYPVEQTCCGQPMANTGCVDQARPLARRFVQMFRGFDHVVCPSGSCVDMVREHYLDLAADVEGFEHVRNQTWELCEFIKDVLRIEEVGAPRFARRVGLHQGCHGLRGLRLGNASELAGEHTSKIAALLRRVDGLELVNLSRPDECCGFGGTFAVSEEAVSCAMGRDRVEDHQQAGAEVITSADMSCLMHMDGLIRRERRPVRVMHVAEILAGEASLQ